jgi:phosphatidylglycerol lysyltransferase
MDVLLVRLLLHFQSEGYRHFDLGMAPLSGIAEHALAPHWHRLARLLFEHGESFYNFRGVRSFKDKFSPIWEPRYLATTGMTPLAALTNVAALVGGGLKGVFAK